MKYFTALQAAASAFAVVQALNPGKISTDWCPANEVQPNGQLPPSTIYPQALVPISKREPDTPFFSVDNIAEISPGDKCTITNFMIPVAEAQHKTCSLVFDFPNWGNYNYSGSGHFNFIGYALGAFAIPGVTTYNRQPAAGPSPQSPPPVMSPGHSYVLMSAPCNIPPDIPGGIAPVSGAICSEDTAFSYKQTMEPIQPNPVKQGLGGWGKKPCPLGFFVILS
ncbi:uncharacterized protein EI97DRAFT_399272 [Westerdykella ornata]|uniref:Ubiquitin 3 binding protein But2 C-terminal domain-containing protein n=1 Tax=Westerdykella ornata TaxID=318751 RepID=A0A6A6JIA3_WESOR|nr:uncharacterized protein EI97DRAFT_399272 [Westerdykella ornata]KAF2275813.1 hypothetical protein EI97DRAFT_399272 [Westerdykella ornata]